jgi:hypothetical protein
LRCKNFSIRYSEKGPIDIFVEAKESILGKMDVPVDILFLKRDRAVYLLLMSPNNPKEGILPNFLYNIVSGRE